jgi:hypothetical protein
MDARNFGWLLCLLPLVYAGCEAIPVSQHPLSNEETSRIDPDLIGMWDVIGESNAAIEPAPMPAPAGIAARESSPAKEPATEKVTEEKPEETDRPPRLAFGRLAGKEHVHEMVSMHFTEEGQVDVQRAPFYATQIGEQRYVSMRADPTVDGSDFVLIKYERLSEKRFVAFMLDREVISQAIQRGELKGVVRKAAPADPSDPNSEPRKESIRITAEPKELREYLAKHGQKAFMKQATWRLEKAAAN